MEIRTFWAIPLLTYSDSLLKLSYLKVLTKNKFETLKLPTNLANYRYQHLVSPNYLLNIEVIKTRKNWILKNILEVRTLSKPDTYSDFLKLTELTKILCESFQEDQEVDLLEFVTRYLLEVSLKEANLADFEKEVMIKLGFA